MKILVIGHTSMVGKRLCNLLATEHTVFTAGRKQSDIVFDLAAFGQDIHFQEKVDAIVHCAASFGGDTLPEAIENELINSVGAYRVMQLAQQTDCGHLIYISSTSVYEKPENEYYGSYALSKKHGEDNLRVFCRRGGLSYTALRPTCLFDEKGEAGKHQYLLYLMIDRALHGEDIQIYGARDSLRNYLYIEDFVTIIKKVIELGITGTYPCAFERSYTIREIAEIANSCFGSKGKIELNPDKPNIPTMYVPHESDLYRLIGYTPETDLRKGIELIKSYLDRKG